MQKLNLSAHFASFRSLCKHAPALRKRTGHRVVSPISSTSFHF
jgi:hypothetical protein